MGKATYTVTVTNNSNGVSVDYETEAPMELLIPDVAADVVKDLVNTRYVAGKLNRPALRRA